MMAGVAISRKDSELLNTDSQNSEWLYDIAKTMQKKHLIKCPTPSASSSVD